MHNLTFCSLLLSRKSLTIGLLLLLGACSESSTPPSSAENDQAPTTGYTLVETVAAGSSEIVIPYSKYKLDNGLTLIVHEDTSDPLVHVDITYHVGSAREEAQRSGFAHFFEHMMFQGSDHVADEQHIGIVTESGGTMNGGTSFDTTNYFETVPSNQLETMLWLESDRMGYFLNAVTEEKFENQRATVKNERNQNYENSPYGLWSEKTFTTVFPPEHPYSWMPIGFIADLDSATLADLKQFFLRWYGPNNATLTIGGNVNPQQAVELVVKYFGEIPAGPEVLPATKTPAVLTTDRYISYVDNNIRFPALIVSFPTVALDHPDRVALEALNEILTVGRKSFFYKEFILTQKAIEASGANYALELAGVLNFFILPFPGTPLATFEADLRGVFAGFNADSISDEDLQIYQATQEASLINSLASVTGKVRQLATNETYLGNPNNIQKELDDIRALTKADILRVIETYIKGKPAVYLSVVAPAAPDLISKADDFTTPERLARISSNDSVLEQREAGHTLDRTVRPTPPANPLVNMPPIWQQSLDNGIDFIGTASSEVPLVNLQLVFSGGHLLENPAQYGIASLTASMMNEGTTTFSAEDFEKELDKLGSNISVSSDDDTMSINMQSLQRNFDATLSLLQERLFNSDFTQADLDRIKQQTIESLQAQQEEPTAITENAYRKLLYGTDHAFSVSTNGTVATVEKLTLADVEAFRDLSLVTQTLQVTVVGDIPQPEVLSKLGFLQNLPNTAVSLRSQPATAQLAGGTLYLIDKPGAAQSEIRIGYMGSLTYDSTGEYFERYLMNYVLGSAFNSRINLNLRENKGYTYGARSNFSASKIPGPFTASASVRADATADSVVQFVNEIKTYRDQGITPTELQFTKDASGQSEALDYETPRQKLGLLQQIITYNLPLDFTTQQQNIINGLTQERINSLALAHLPLEKMVILVVGDKALINTSLTALGYPIVELDTEANPVN